MEFKDDFINIYIIEDKNSIIFLSYTTHNGKYGFTHRNLKKDKFGVYFVLKKIKYYLEDFNHK